MSERTLLKIINIIGLFAPLGTLAAYAVLIFGLKKPQASIYTLYIRQTAGLMIIYFILLFLLGQIHPFLLGLINGFVLVQLLINAYYILSEKNKSLPVIGPYIEKYLRFI